MAPHGWKLDDKFLVELNKSALFNGLRLGFAERLLKVFIEGERNDRLW